MSEEIAMSAYKKAKTADGKADANTASIAHFAQQLDAHKADTANEINELQSQVSGLASGAPKAASTVAEMTDTTKVYVYTGSEEGYTAGNWYYYNGSAWVSGGVYQSTGIADGSIKKSALGTKLKSIIDSIYDESNEIAIDNLDTTTSARLSSTARFFVNHPIPANSYIGKIKIYLGSVDNCTVTVEVWSKSNDTLTLEKSVEHVHNNIVGIKELTIDYSTHSETYISFAASAPLVFAMNDLGGCLYKKDKESTSLSFSELSSFSAVLPCVQIIYTKYIYKVPDIIERIDALDAITRGTIINVGEGMDYETIQDAIDNCDDSGLNHVTILVYPGVYERFSMTSGSNILRYISIIGINKYECIIKDDTGNYLTPPAKIRTNGLIKNLTFIATHENEVWESDRRKAYAIHLDFGTENLRIEDCICVSYQAPAIGIGMHADEKIHIKDCELYSYATSDYGSLVDYGGLYCHSRNADNIMGQEITIENTRIYSQNGNKAALIQKLGEGGEFLFRSINSTYYSYSDGVGAVINNTATLTPDSHGNNVTALNN
jgi:hypothetical protein